MKKELDKIEMYTDGACSGNPGPGGWGTILRFGSAEKSCQAENAAPQTTEWS